LQEWASFCARYKGKLVYFLVLGVVNINVEVAGEREVKAQIKLRFRNAAGKPMVVTRSLSLVQKQTKQEFNTIDSALQTFNNLGEV
jgi:hypothetical protein